MGATEFVTYGTGSSLDEAFTLARAEAGWSGGYEYPGSIAAKDAAKKILSTPMPRDVAYEYANDLLSADGSPYGDKWDHYCYAIPVCTDSAFTKTRTIRVPVTTTEAHLSSHFVRRDALATLSPEDRKAVISVNIPKDLPAPKCKVSVEATHGKAVMRYRVCDSFGQRTFGTYNTQSEARRALKQHINSHAYRDELVVIGVRERENGDPLVRASKTVLPTAVTVSVALGAPKHNYAPEGWIFFGVAPS